MKRLSISLDEADYEALVERAKADARPVASAATLLIRLGLQSHPMDSPDRSAKGGWSTKVERQPDFERAERLAFNRAGHEWVGIKDGCMKMGCQYPRDKKAHG